MLLTDYRRQPWQVDRETLTFTDLYQHWLQEKGPGLSKPTLAKAKTSYGSRMFSPDSRAISAFCQISRP